MEYTLKYETTFYGDDAVIVSNLTSKNQELEAKLKQQILCGNQLQDKCDNLRADSVEQQQYIKQLKDALRGVLAITNDCWGVVGYNSNDDVTQWCEFDEVHVAETVLNNKDQSHD